MMAPLILPPGKGHALHLRFLRSAAQKVARAMRDNPDFKWKGLGRSCANISLYLAPGRYLTPGGSVIPWGKPDARAILCHGKNAPFENPQDVPLQIMQAVEAGVAEALLHGAHVFEDGLIIGRRLGLTDALRTELRVWLLWPCDMPRELIEARAKARRREKAAAKRAKRRAAGMRPREEYEAESIAAKARSLGLKPDTLRARLRRAAHVPSRVASVSEAHMNIVICPADRHATKRDTVAGQARAMGLKPDTLRKRLLRERQRAALNAAPPRIVSPAPAADHLPMLPSELFDDFLARAGLRLHPEARARAIDDLSAHIECFGAEDALDDEALTGLAEIWRGYPSAPEEIEAMEAA